MSFRKKCFFIFLLQFLFIFRAFSIDSVFEPQEIKYLRKAYPDLQIYSYYDEVIKDWQIKVVFEKQSIVFVWAEGRLLPEEKLSEKEKYEKLFYLYPDGPYNPENFTREDIENIKKITSRETRKNSNITPPYFFDFIYQSNSRAKVEKHIKGITFLGLKLNVHDRIAEKVKIVEKQIKSAAETDEETALFVKNMASTGGYNWREISDSGSRSFHSLGIAVDVLPKGWNQKNVYWSWRRDLEPDTWMMLSLERRWMPPEKVIKIFEENGFIWGGKWIVWDNMHFEYRPELVVYKREKS